MNSNATFATDPNRIASTSSTTNNKTGEQIDRIESNLDALLDEVSHHLLDHGVMTTMTTMTVIGSAPTIPLLSLSKGGMGLKSLQIEPRITRAKRKKRVRKFRKLLWYCDKRN
jgi:hypothetical protein